MESVPPYRKIRQANLILDDSERIINNARDEEKIVERAEKQAEYLLEENEIVAQPRAYAEDIVRKPTNIPGG